MSQFDLSPLFMGYLKGERCGRNGTQCHGYTQTDRARSSFISLFACMLRQRPSTGWLYLSREFTLLSFAVAANR